MQLYDILNSTVVHTYLVYDQLHDHLYYHANKEQQLFFHHF